MMAIALIKEMKETRSLYYTSKHPVIESIFPPQWLASKENKEAEFLSRHHAVMSTAVASGTKYYISDYTANKAFRKL